MADGNNIKSGNKAGTESLNKITNIDKKEDNNKNESSLCSSPAEKALKNTLVLQNIFKFLPYNDLLTCQSADLPLWESEAKLAIAQRPLLNITWKFQSNIEKTKTLNGRKSRSEFARLSKLLFKLETREKGHEIWLAVNQIEFPMLKMFTSKFGNAICKLTLSYGPPHNTTPADLQELLSSLPNLNHFLLDNVPRFWKFEQKLFPNQASKSYSAPVLLLQVKTVEFGSHYCFYPDLLMGLFEMMPNLDNIINFPLSCVPTSASDNKLKLDKIKSVDLTNLLRAYYKWKKTEPSLSRLLNIRQHLKLREVCLCLPMVLTKTLETQWIHCHNGLARILESNKSTIEHLTILPVLLEYPEMKAVKKLCFADLVNPLEIGNGINFFGKYFDASKLFPNLVEVTLEFMLTDFCKFFPANASQQSCFHSVTSLNVDCFYGGLVTVKALEQVARFFPNVTSLTTNGDVRGLERQLDQAFRLWPKLVSLKMKVQVPIPKSSGVIAEYSLDPVFTGISMENCNKLRESKEKIGIDLQSYRQNFAISNMTELKNLTLILDRKYGEKQGVIPLLSHVAAFYGFQCVPDLKVTVAIVWDSMDSKKIQEMLNPIKDLVNFNPNYDPFN